MNEYNPDIVSHPGSMLNEKLQEIGMGPMELATRMGKPNKTISAVVNGKSAITPDMAVQLERVLGIPAHLWLRYQAAFDESRAKQREDEVLLESVDWTKSFPYTKLANLGWVKDVRGDKERTLELLSFFGLASPKAWNDYYLNATLSNAFRMSLRRFPDPYAVSAWLRNGDIEAERNLLGTAFDKSRLRSSLPEFKAIMSQNPHHLLNSIKDLGKELGMIIVFTPSLSGAPIHGAVRWYRDTPVVQLSDRCRRYDIFWFSLLHEFGHILLHGKKDIFLEGFPKVMEQQKEKEADAFAADVILPERLALELMSHEQFSKALMHEFASKAGVHPAMIIGRLQYEKKLAQGAFRNMIPEISFQ